MPVRGGTASFCVGDGTKYMGTIYRGTGKLKNME